jgi:hypothetical protein
MTITTTEQIVSVPMTINDIATTLTVTVPASFTVAAPVVIGYKGEPGVDYDVFTSWFSLASGFETITAQATTLPGKVYRLDYVGGAIRYRYIATDRSIDGIYVGFSDPTLTGLIVTRKI